MNLDLSTLGPLAEAVEKAGAPILGGALRAASLVSGAAPFPLNAILPPILGALADAVGGSADDPNGIAQKIDADPAVVADKIKAIEVTHADDLGSALDFSKLQVEQNEAELAAMPSFWGKVFFAGYRPLFMYSVVTWSNVLLIRAILGFSVSADFLVLWNPIWIAFGAQLGLRTVEKMGGVATDFVSRVLPARKQGR